MNIQEAVKLALETRGQIYRKELGERITIVPTDSLEIADTALFDADFLVTDRAYHALFDLEDFHGLLLVLIFGIVAMPFVGLSLILRRNSGAVTRFIGFVLLLIAIASWGYLVYYSIH